MKRFVVVALLITFCLAVVYSSEIKRSNDMNDTKTKDMDAVYYDLSTIYDITMYEGRKIANYYYKKVSEEWRRKKRDGRLLVNLPNQNSIETIFKPKHKTTKTEFYSILVDYYGEGDYNEIFSQDVAYYHLSLLYKWRGDNKKSDEYWGKIGVDLRETLEYIDWDGIILPSTIDKINKEIKFHETIYDHNPTDEELRAVTNHLWLKERYLIAYANFEYDVDLFFEDISKLYSKRAYASLTERHYVDFCLFFPEGYVFPEEYKKIWLYQKSTMQ